MLQDIIEGLRLFLEYDSSPRIQITEGEIRIILVVGTAIGEDDLGVLKKFNWRFSEGDWVLWI